ncbi:hypothetical protein [Rhodococcus ruber]|uniref:hypothetical protein n=1 Tax=Rhodococcus ruber TaxID=1830 RepID=UPI000F51F7D5|nr:hypothetical protein [Rhodococcus ruber]
MSYTTTHGDTWTQLGTTRPITAGKTQIVGSSTAQLKVGTGVGPSGTVQSVTVTNIDGSVVWRDRMDPQRRRVDRLIRFE